MATEDVAATLGASSGAADVAATLGMSAPSTAKPVDKPASVASPAAAPTVNPKQGLNNLVQQEQALRDQYAKDYERMQGKAPVAPELKPWTQKEPEADPVKAFGSWASAFGILASALTRTPLTSALNASAAAMTAIRQGDLSRYKDAKETFKENTELAVKNYDLQHKAYDDALALMRDNHAEGWAAVKTVAATYNDIWARNTADEQALIQRQEAGQRMRFAADDHMAKMLETGAQQAHVLEVAQEMAGGEDKLKALKPQERMAAYGKAALKIKVDEEMALRRQSAEQMGEQNWLVNHPGKDHLDYLNAKSSAVATGKQEGVLAEINNGLPADKEMVHGTGMSKAAVTEDAMQWILSGKQPTPARGPLANAQLNAVKEERVKLMDTMGLTAEQVAMIPAERKADVAALAKDGMSLDGTKTALNQFENMFPIAEEYAAKLGLTEVQRLNAAILKGDTEFGSADANNYANAMATIAMEFGRLAAPQSNAMPPVALMQIGMQRLGPAITPTQLKGEHELAVKEATAKIKSFQQTIDDRRSKLLRPIGAEPSLRPAGGAAPSAPNPQAKAALDWANANPNDPRAAQVRAKAMQDLGGR